MLLVHARAASLGFGTPSINKNNHPFVSSDKTVGLIHNGRMSDIDYRTFKKKYEVFSDCDSELYLRIFESQKNRIESLKTLWSMLGKSQMAVAIGERLEGYQRRLWLFRNKWRSLWLADLRQSLGQIFFFSTAEIWEESVWFCEEARSYLKKSKMIEMPAEEILQITYAQNDFKKNHIEVKSSGALKPWTFDGQFVKINKTNPKHKIITLLDDDEELVNKTNCRHSTVDDWSKELFPDMSNDKKSAERVSEVCEEIRNKLTDIETMAENLLMENSMSVSDYQELITSLDSVVMDLEGTKKIIGVLHG